MDQCCVNEFVAAAKINDIAEVINTLENTPSIINEKNSQNGLTALMIACSSGQTAMAELLLAKGADPNIEDDFGNTALINACTNMALVKLLLDKGADPNHQSKNGCTALMLASSNGQTSMVELLLEYGADMRIENNNGNTAHDLADCDETRRALRLFSLHASRGTRAQLTCIIKSSDIAVFDKISSTDLLNVYRGKYRGTDVAVKMLRRDYSMDVSISDLQYKEIEILSNLRHPRIVSLMGVVFDINNGYGAMLSLVTEFTPRGSLYDVLHLNTIPPEHRLSTLSSKLRVLRDVADGMRFLHMSNVIHRDLKSPNVLLYEDGRAKICDCEKRNILTEDISYMQSYIDSLPWSSPESIVGRLDIVRQSSDVYSFGVILWEMLTNSIPLKGFSTADIFIRLVKGESLPLDAVASIADTPPHLIAMLEQCLSRNPEHRPTFEHIVQCFSDVLPSCIEREGRVPCPNAYLCPIGYEIMEDPVICSDGHTYDRVNIERWLQDNDTSPLTNMILEDKTLRPNIALRGMIHEFKDANA